MTLRFGDEEVFRVFNSHKNPSSFASFEFYSDVDITDMVIFDNFYDLTMVDPVEKFLTLQDPNMLMGGEEEEILMFLQAHHSQRSWKNKKLRKWKETML